MINKLNKGQEKAASDFLGFLVTDEKRFTLSGGAGTGKTTLVNHIIGEMGDYNAVLEVIGKKGLKEVIVTATTNKAAEVIGAAIGIEATTLHSRLGLVIENDYQTGRTKIKRGSKHAIVSDSLIVVDEISLIDTPMLAEVEASTINCKFLFIGDKRQLAPIYEPISPLFVNPQNIAYLTERMRMRGSPALEALNQQMEDTVDTGVFKPIVAVPGSVEYLDNKGMEAHMQTFFLTPEPQSRVLCYSNNRVLQYNNHLRYELGLSGQFTVGERLVAATAVRNPHIGGSINPEQWVTILDVDTPGINEYLYQNFKYEVETYMVETTKGAFWQPTDHGHLQRCMKHAGKEKNWQAYFYMKECIADFRMPHAATVYKSQGSTYPTVYIDLDDIGKCNNADQVARMLYVAISRAQNKVYLYGKLPAKYGG